MSWSRSQAGWPNRNPGAAPSGSRQGWTGGARKASRLAGSPAPPTRSHKNAAATSQPGKTDDAAPPIRPAQHHTNPAAMTGAREALAAELAAPLESMTSDSGRQTKPSLAQMGICHEG